MDLLPKEFIQYINMQNIYCTCCQTRFNIQHYEKHGLNLQEPDQLVQRLNMEVKGAEYQNGIKFTREEKLDFKANKIKEIIQEW